MMTEAAEAADVLGPGPDLLAAGTTVNWTNVAIGAGTVVGLVLIAGLAARSILKR